jgi:hypothetical protein
MSAVFARQSVEAIGVALAARAQKHLAGGHPEKAWSDAKAVLRLGELVARTQILISHLNGLRLREMGYKVLYALAQDPRLPQDQAETVLRELDASNQMPRMARTLNFGERLFVLDAIMTVWSRAYGSVLSSKPAGLNRNTTLSNMSRDVYDPNIALRKINNLFDHLARLGQVEPYKDYRKAHTQYMSNTTLNLDIEKAARWYQSWRGQWLAV